MTKRTHVDANLLIAAWQGKGELGLKALTILDDPARNIVVSRAVWLEVMPKPVYHKQNLKTEFYQQIFDAAEVLGWSTQALNMAESLARRHGIAAMDAIHLALAIKGEVDELVTAEKAQKPMFRVEDISDLSIRD